jgi:hypothetical protein
MLARVETTCRRLAFHKEGARCTLILFEAVLVRAHPNHDQTRVDLCRHSDSLVCALTTTAANVVTIYSRTPYRAERVETHFR